MVEGQVFEHSTTENMTSLRTNHSKMIPASVMTNHDVQFYVKIQRQKKK